ncbi:helix-turn-helix domain-containing protein [Marinilabilia salmonicolor]|uniref:helix-turn-helix domain-containing protein n=1 Tax=Marinilabilia salmonicolor TaxID=989 RepID=UPI0002D354B6|nr:helix-turn-helix domain-containing protein [Marinilabilia salmonicolor]
MASQIMIIDEHEFGKLMRKIDRISDKLENLDLKSNDGFKEKWYVSDEVCKILKVSKRTLQNMRDNQTIKFRKSGKKIYYKASDIEEYLNKI